jgi:hypothetical protein
LQRICASSRANQALSEINDTGEKHRWQFANVVGNLTMPIAANMRGP